MSSRKHTFKLNKKQEENTMNEVWNLNVIYEGFEDPQYDKDLSLLKEKAAAYAAATGSLADAEPLDGLKLERFIYLSPKASTKEQNTFTTIHPKAECITVFYGYSQPYGYGWRYDDNGKTMFWYYKDVIREVFEYDKADKILKAQEDAKK